ncbi:MAG: hypothetical protein HRU20_04720 [Pseudomonadales bacterium]|nr:hypothetical protein [Pseudomonadales bacterium]
MGRSVNAVSSIGVMDNKAEVDVDLANKLSTGRWKMWQLSLNAVADAS